MNIDLNDNNYIITEILGQKYDMQIINEKKNGKITLNKVGTNVSLGYVTYKDDILDGDCKLKDNEGKLIRECTFHNGVISGWGKEYKDGKLIFEGVYENNRRKKQIEKYAETSKLYKEIEDGEIKYICEYDENHKKYGKGYICENGFITKCVEFNNDDVVKEYFAINNDNNNAIMTEKDDNGETIYIGTFSGSISSEFSRLNGKEIKNNQVIYEGDWYHNKRHGKGKLKISDDLVYEGEWKGNLPNGHGTLTKEGHIFNGEWTNGYFIPESIESNELRYAIKYDGTSCLVDKQNNVIYEGELENDVPHGTGKCILEDNTTIEGEWESGICILKDGKEIEIDSEGNACMREMKRGSMFGCCMKWKTTDLSLQPLQIVDNIEIGSSIQTSAKLPEIKPKKQTINKSIIFGMIKFDTLLWNVSELIIEEINLNNSSNNIEISEYHTLQSIILKNTAFKSLNQSKFLRISNNNHLKEIVFEEPNDKNVLEYISKVELAG